ncbi:MAG: 1-deoxy-D-xylulose-5-phosphate reductoisomerase [Alphaproteobacteria bacterium]|nr:1-deoxy-D-xylulose-5-phosphate reductoisomerase [Alphaproteobacteria bacterium]
MTARRVSILGATGSIGRSTVAVIEELRAQGKEIEVEAIAAGSDVEGIAELARRLRPAFVAVADESRADDLRAAINGAPVAVAAGRGAVIEAAARPADWVMAAIVGVAGLDSTLAAIDRGATVAIANKESFACAGPLVRDAAARSGAVILPVDSEHNAIFQVLLNVERVEKVTITASGGPFRSASLETMRAATPAQACAHPNWSMGAKISIDSATLMNKGLELIEAAYLFDLPAERLDVLVHPQSIVHSLVHYADGSVLAHMAAPDMRTPIAHTLAWPDRARVSTPRLDLAKTGALTFEAPDVHRFPALQLARTALEAGPKASCALNAANEIAVAAFVDGQIGFLDIARLVGEVLEQLERKELGGFQKSPSSFDEVRAIDQAARKTARAIADGWRH